MKTQFKSMKNSTIWVLSMFLLGLFVIYSCEKPIPVSDPINDIIVTPDDLLVLNPISDITFSKCKTEKSNENAADVEITYKDKYLYVTHKDLLLNCGFEEVNITSSVDGYTIELNIEENPTNLRCLCPVDISYSVGEFEKGTYTLVIKHYKQQIYTQTVHF